MEILGETKRGVMTSIVSLSTKVTVPLSAETILTICVPGVTAGSTCTVKRICSLPKGAIVRFHKRFGARVRLEGVAFTKISSEGKTSVTVTFVETFSLFETFIVYSTKPPGTTLV